MISIEQIRAARAWLNLTQLQVAEAAGVEVRTIQRIEKGFRGATETTLEKIRNAFEARGIDFMFDGARPVGIRLTALMHMSEMAV
jgi:transcriptional regulator with XRE-family HTH domain